MRRIAQFGAVGVLCLVVQIGIFHLIRHYWSVASTTANIAAFILSAQLNFILSYNVTWSDSKRHLGMALVATWMRFNGVVIVSAVLNSICFHVLDSITIDDGALVAAALASAAFTFALNHFVVLQPKESV